MGLQDDKSSIGLKGELSGVLDGSSIVGEVLGDASVEVSGHIRSAPERLETFIGIHAGGSASTGKKMSALFESLSMVEFVLLLERQNYLREFPTASIVEVNLHLSKWLTEHEGAALGDGWGRPVSVDRFRCSNSD